MNSTRGSNSLSRDDGEEEGNSSTVTAKDVGAAAAVAAGVAFLGWGISKLWTAAAIEPRSYSCSDDEAPAVPGARIPESSVAAVRWKKPPRGFYKLNVDGSHHLGMEFDGAGCIIRDDKGSFVAAAAYRLRGENISIIEAEALWKGVQLAKEMQIEYLLIESDNSEVVRRVNGVTKACDSLSMEYLVSVIHNEISEREWELSYVKREANSAADKLANMGANGKIGKWIKDSHPPLPSNVANLVETDKNGG